MRWLAVAAVVWMPVSTSATRAVRQQQEEGDDAMALVTPAWDWEPDPSNVVQHCLTVPQTTGFWPHEIPREVNHTTTWVEVNESMVWANNSRLLSLAVPEGTPPAGGWPVMMRLLVVDFPVRTPGAVGIDQGQQTCGLDGQRLDNEFVDPAQVAAKAKCASLVNQTCGVALQKYSTCVDCAMNNYTNRRGFLAAGCTNQMLQQLTMTGGELCPLPRVSHQCNESIASACGWTQVLRNKSNAEPEPWWRYFMNNCSQCVRNWTRSFGNQSTQARNHSWQATSCPAAEYPLMNEYCQPEEYPWRHNGMYHVNRWFYPFSSPHRMASECSCINGSEFSCFSPSDDGHIADDLEVKPGGYCDNDVFVGGLWAQRIKQYLLNNGIAVMDVNNYVDDGWESWKEIWQGGYDPPFFAALVNAMNGRTAIDGLAGPVLRSLNPQKIIFHGWSGAAHMVSFLIEQVATHQLPGIGIAAGVMMSGGSMACYDEPPLARGVCANCNTSDNSYMQDPAALGCSSTFAERGLSAPYCQLCCPENFTEPFYAAHPSEYRNHPPTFLTQTTIDQGADR